MRRPLASPIAAIGLLLALLGVLALARTAPTSVPAPRPIAAPAPVAPGLVDLNDADAVALATLPRVGPTLAARIVADRARRGPFETVDDLDRVPGVGPRTIEELRPHVRVSSGRVSTGGAPARADRPRTTAAPD